MNGLRSRLAVALVVVAAFAAGAGVIAARSGLTTTVVVVTEPPQPVVTAAVERRILEDSVVTRGSVEVTEVVPIFAPSVDGARSVVTSIELAVGESIEEGTVVASVAGRPIIVLEGAFPAFRDLGRGSGGVDVLQLQEALARLGLYGGVIDGVYGWATESAVRELYGEGGYEWGADGAGKDGEGGDEAVPKPTTTAGIQIFLDEVVFVPELPADVVAVHVGVGDVLGDAGVLVDLATGEVRIRTAVPATRIAGIAVGAVAVILDEASGATFEAEVVAVAAEPKSDSGRLEHDVDLRPLGSASDLVGRNVRVTFTLSSSSGPVLAVPITAVWTGDGDSVFVTVSDGGTTRDIGVIPGLVIGGWVEIVDADETFSEGDLVVVTR
ncbi:MAG: peptidoglycan-binding protein [Actinobacteria bacterium]|nr:peptidoglycan-binding protein [Actinomycetota bacterium]